MPRHDIYPTLPLSPNDSGLASYIDIDGREPCFGGDDQEFFRDLFLAVAQATLLNFGQIWCAMELAIDKRKDDARQLWAERFAEAKTDAALLRLPLPVEEAFEIWRRSCAGLRFVAENDPDPEKRQELLDAVAQSEARMAERIEQHIQKYETRKNGRAQA